MSTNNQDSDGDIFASDSEESDIEDGNPTLSQLCSSQVVRSWRNTDDLKHLDENFGFVIDRKQSHQQTESQESEAPNNVESDSENSEEEFSVTKEVQLSDKAARGQDGTTKANKNGFELSSSLQDGLSTDVYVSMDFISKSGTSQIPGCSSDKQIDKLLQKSVLPKDAEKLHSLPPYEVSLHQTRKLRQKERSQTKGKSWYNMKAPEMTEEKKNDLTVLQMRRVLDPKRFYKNPDIRALPKFFQMGKVVEDATDFYSARVPKKQRKSTLVDELLEDAEFRRYNKKKYTEILQKNQKHTKSGAAKHMKRLKKKKK